MQDDTKCDHWKNKFIRFLGLAYIIIHFFNRMKKKIIIFDGFFFQHTIFFKIFFSWKDKARVSLFLENKTDEVFLLIGNLNHIASLEQMCEIVQLKLEIENEFKWNFYTQSNTSDHWSLNIILAHINEINLSQTHLQEFLTHWPKIHPTQHLFGACWNV